MKKFIIEGRNMKKGFLLLLFLGFLSLQAQDNRIEFLSSFLVGEYEMIGKYPNGQLYNGTMTIATQDSQLIFLREIGDKVIKGLIEFNYITADSILTAVIEFSSNTMHYRIEYLIHSDAGNYPRLTGKIYPTEAHSNNYGIESLFYKQENH